MCIFTAYFLFLSPSHAYASVKPPAKVPPNLASLYDVLAPKLIEGSLFMYIVPPNGAGPDDTSQPNWWKTCVYTSPISEEGIKMAGVIRRSLTKLGVKVGFVNTGESCRALSLASFFTGHAGNLNLFVTPDLDGPEIQRINKIPDGVVEQRVLSYFRARIPNFLTINVGAKLTPTTAPHPVMTDLSPGESALFEVSQSGALILAAKLNWQQWDEMARYVSAKSPKTKVIKKIAK
jgi:hypothetical protein